LSRCNIQQIVGRERRERLSQLVGAAKGALIRAAASTQTFGGAKPLLEMADEILDLEYK